VLATGEHTGVTCALNEIALVRRRQGRAAHARCAAAHAPRYSHKMDSSFVMPLQSVKR
jgi:hypothetical protein